LRALPAAWSSGIGWWWRQSLTLIVIPQGFNPGRRDRKEFSSARPASIHGCGRGDFIDKNWRKPYHLRLSLEGKV
jgi:hypothetical protein